MKCNRLCKLNQKETNCVCSHQESLSDLNSAPNASKEKDYGAEALMRNRVKQSIIFGMIDAYSGAQKFELPLISLNGGYNLSFKISYDSSQTKKGSLGSGWSHCFERKLIVEEDDAYLYERPGIYQIYRRWDHDNLFWGRTMGYFGYQLFENRDGYRIECNNVSTEYYDFKGNLTKIKDRNGRELRFLYQENQTIVTDLLTKKNLYLEFDESGKLIRVCDANDRTVEFTYEGDRLTEICDVNGNHHFYVYDEAGRMVSEYSAEQVRLYTNTYDEEGRVIRCEDGKDQAITLRYDDNIRFITDRNGNSYQLTFNRHGLLAEQADPEGNIFSYTYTPNGYPETVTDPYGNKTTIEYLGYYKPWRYTDNNGHRTEFSYERDNLSKITYPDGSVETFSWNYKNLLIEHCDLRGTITTFSYDENRNLICKKIGKKKTFHYDYEDGLMIAERDAKGYTIRYKYNKYGQMTAKIDTAGRPTNYEYDLSGRLLKVTDSIGGSKAYTYNCNDLVTSVTDARGNCTTYLYDENQNLERVIFADETEIVFEYDAENHLLKQIDQEGDETNYDYDSIGRLTFLQMPNGKMIQYQYDSVGNMIKEVKADGQETTFSYDAMGNPLTATNSANQTMRYQYDCHSHIIREVNPFGGTTFFQYSSAGDLLAKTDPFGCKTVYTYDDYGNRTGVCDPRGNVTRYIYDNNDNILAIMDPLGNSIHYEYDSYNRAVKKTDQKNQSERYLYDAVGRFIGMTDAKKNFINIFYDIAGNLQTLRDAKQNELFSIQYDAMNRPECSIDVFGHKTTFQYDKTGHLKAVTDPLGNIRTLAKKSSETAGSNLPTDTRKIFYDLFGRVTAYGDEDDSVSINYDENGNVKTVADKSGISYREYDALNRLVRYTAPNGQTIGYRYDSVGNVIAITYPDQSEVLYTYDANNHLVSVTDWAGRNTWYFYDANNRVIGVSKPNGQVITLIYDEAGRVASKEIGSDEEKVHLSFIYTYDEAGRIKTETETVNNQTKCYTYDEQSRIVRLTVTDANEEICSEQTFSYDESGNMTVANGGEIFVYDLDNKPIAHNGESIIYDRNGNIQNATIGGIEWNFQYDHSNRLICANEEQYLYDAENRCVGIQTDKTKKEIFYDLKNGGKPLTVTVNGIESKLVYGWGLIGMETAGTFYTYLFDRKGNTTKIVNEKQEDILSDLTQTETPLTLFLNKGFNGNMTIAEGIYFKNAQFYCKDFSRPLNLNLLPSLF